MMMAMLMQLHMVMMMNHVHRVDQSTYVPLMMSS
jgi:hypothetical protein